MPKLLKIQVKVEPEGKVRLYVQGRTEAGKYFQIASAVIEAAEVGKKITELTTDYDFSNYPYDNPNAGKAFGTW